MVDLNKSEACMWLSSLLGDYALDLEPAVFNEIVVCMQLEKMRAESAEVNLVRAIARIRDLERIEAGVMVLSEKWDRHSAENYGDRANSLSHCASDLAALLPAPPADGEK